MEVSLVEHPCNGLLSGRQVRPVGNPGAAGLEFAPTGYHRPPFAKALGHPAFMASGTVRPTDIVLHQASRILEVAFDDGSRFRLPCEFLRVFSPSAEVRGHGPGQEVLQVGKQNVNITAIDPVGAYAVKLVFSDGHDTGLYSWDYLHELGRDQDRLWAGYLARLAEAGVSRDDKVPIEVHKFKRAAAPAAAPRFTSPPTDE
jgi:DUF971 family protein